MKKSFSLLAIGIVFNACLVPEQNMLAQEKQNRAVSGFSSIHYSLPGDLRISQSNEESLTIKGDEELIKHIVTETENGCLKIYSDKEGRNFAGDLEISVTVIKLEELSLAGSGDVKFEGTLNTDDLEINLSGSGDIKLPEVKATSIDLNLAGSGNILLGGVANEKSEINIAGSGDVQAENLETNTAEVNISGSGSASIYVKEYLETNIIGSGSINYKGNPRIDASKIGSGSVNPI